MSITLVASASLGNDTGGTTGNLGVGGTTSPNVDTTGATLLTATFGYFPSGSVSDSMGNTWALAVSATTFWTSEIRFVANPTVGSGHNFSLSGTYCNAEFAAWMGTATSTPLDVTNQKGASPGGTTLQPGSVTPANAGSLVVTNAIYNQSNSCTMSDSGFVMQKTGDGGGHGGGAYGGAYDLSQTGAVNPTFSGLPAGGNQQATIAVFKPSTGGGGGGTPESYTILFD